MKQTEQPEIFTEPEIDAMILAFAEGCGEDGFTEDQFKTFYRWAIDVRSDASLLALVLAGKLSAAPTDDPRNFTFKLRGAA